MNGGHNWERYGGNSPLVLLVWLVAGAGAATPAAAEKYTPDHPVVQRMVESGVHYLEQASFTQLGEYCLASLCLINQGAPHDHPILVATLKECERMTVDLEDVDAAIDIYNTGLAIVFLCNYDPHGQRKLIGRYVDSLIKRKKPQGAWGYPAGLNLRSCDTSQTQYAILGLWYMQFKEAGPFPAQVVADACNWLIVTQDPSGAWGYQGREGSGGERVTQSEVRPSLVAAGLSSVYLCANMLRLTRAPKGLEEPGLLGRLRPTTAAELSGQRPEESSSRWVPRTRDVSQARLKRAMEDGQHWFDANFKNFSWKGTEWTHYFMYAYERYESFREIAESSYEASPDWYNAGVEFLKETQSPDGSWTGEVKPHINTCFAVLFLQRSTQKALEPYRDGRLTGGRGLPQNLQEARVLGGKIQGRQFEGSMNDLLAALEDPQFRAPVDVTGRQQEFSLSTIPDERRQQIEHLRRLIAHDRQGARLVAVQCLAQTQDLLEVPYLIYALSDPDPQVMRAARDGLRRLSRKFNGFGLPDHANPAEVQAAMDAWKEWYRRLRPDAQFLD